MADPGAVEFFTQAEVPLSFLAIAYMTTILQKRFPADCWTELVLKLLKREIGSKENDVRANARPVGGGGKYLLGKSLIFGLSMGHCATPGQFIFCCHGHVPTSMSVKSSVKKPVFVNSPTVPTNRTTRQTPVDITKLSC